MFIEGELPGSTAAPRFVDSTAASDKLLAVHERFDFAPHVHQAAGKMQRLWKRYEKRKSLMRHLSSVPWLYGSKILQGAGGRAALRCNNYDRARAGRRAVNLQPSLDERAGAMWLLHARKWSVGFLLASSTGG